jgi:hypothetical protein
MKKLLTTCSLFVLALIASPVMWGQAINGTSTGITGGGVGSAVYQSAANASAFLASPTTSGHTFALAWQPSGSAIAPVALDLATYLASPPPIGITTPNSGAFTTISTTGALHVGATVPTACGSATSCEDGYEVGTAGTPTAGQDYFRYNSSNHTFTYSVNGLAESTLGGLITAHYFLGNNTSAAASSTAALIGTSDVTPNWYTASGGGTAQAQTATLTPAATALTPGLEVRWQPIAANTAAAPTLAVNGLAATPITKFGTTPVVAGDITPTAIAVAIYDGTQFELQDPQTGSSVTGLTHSNPDGFDFSGTMGTVFGGPATPSTTTTATFTSASTTLALTSTTGWPTSGTIAINVGDFGTTEYIKYGSLSGLNLGTLTRGVYGSAAVASQAAGTHVYLISQVIANSPTTAPIQLIFGNGGIVSNPALAFLSNFAPGTNQASSSPFYAQTYNIFANGGVDGILAAASDGGVVLTNNGSVGLHVLNSDGLVVAGGNSVYLTTATTISSATFVTTGLVLPLPPASSTLRGSCHLNWAQSTAVSTVQFGVGMSTAPTNLWVENPYIWNGTAGTRGSYLALATTTTTAITPTIAPAVIATVYSVDFNFTLQTTTGTQPALTIYGLTGATGDALVIEPGSACGWDL